MILEQNMNLKQIQVQDPVLKWFYRTVFAKIWTYIEAEKEIENLEQIPMTDMIFGLLKDMGGFSEDSVLSFEDWLKFIKAISYTRKPPLTSLQFDNMPHELEIKDKKVSLDAVMEKFQNYIDKNLKLGDKNDLSVKQIQARLSNQFKSDLLKMIQIVTPRVFSQISSLASVQFAIEAIASKGKPQMSQFKMLETFRTDQSKPRVEGLTEELHEFLPKLHTLVGKPPRLNFDLECKEQNLNKLVTFFQKFIDSSGGYIILGRLINDKLLSINNNAKPSFSTISHSDGNGRTFRYGQITSNQLQGIGRKLFIRYEISMDEKDRE